MINIILHWDLGITITNYILYYSRIPEMKQNCYNVCTRSAKEFEILLSIISRAAPVLVVGTYNENGTQYIWEDSNLNHTIEKYQSVLNNKITYDTDYNVIEDRPYTIEEAKNIQVNKFCGWSDRYLN